MSSNQPIITGAGPRYRQFATSVIAVQAIIVNQAQEVVLLSSPTRNQGWQVVSGALEAGETLLDGTLREVREELGTGLKIRPLGMVHGHTFHYDEKVRYVVGCYYLFAYLGGDIIPGDDMVGSEYRWWSISELKAEQVNLDVSTKLWVLERAISLYRLWHDEDPVPLQQSLGQDAD